ncbi:uridine phosphorylase [Ruminococcaceae bacterium OttesenSCG-928-D13]|nr:uridine phosphorylase [Ruminococcaceae bacterium OttesenSCG-928-D13]
MEALYHIGFDDSHGAKYAILPGDPGRVEKIAQYLDNPRFFHQNREYTTWLGECAGEKVLVMSTGMGGPSTAIAVEELYQTGVTTMVRIGTCGGMAEKVIGGDLVIANGSIRMEGTTREYVPIEFPAVADLDVTNALVQAAKNLDATWHVGVVQCKDSFYGQHSPARMPAGYELEQKWQAWVKAGCLASEMESATLYIVGQILGVRTGCVLNTVWNQERKAAGLSDPHSHDNTLAIKAAVEGIRLLVEQDRLG